MTSGEFLTPRQNGTLGGESIPTYLVDFFLVSESLTCDITHSDIVPGFKTDHSMITLTISLHSNPRGNGFWKLNTSLLSEISYIEQVKITIQQTADEYKEDDSVNPALLWEMIKLKVREKSVSYTASKKVATQKRENQVEREIAALEKILDTTDSTALLYHIAAEKIDILKGDLEKILEYRTKGAIIRSKSRWYNEGEKNSRYFLNLEKRHFKQGTISQIKINDDEFITTDKAILSECVSFYKNMYSSKKRDCNHSIFFPQANDTVLSSEEQSMCEGTLTKKECLAA